MENKISKGPKKSKKDIKWYTYVDSELDTKLKKFMELYNIKKQAKVIRDSVNNYIDYVTLVLQKHIEKEEFDDKYIDGFIRKAINYYELNIGYYEELKQKLSPLKTSVLMLNNFLNEPNEQIENIDNIKNALFELEKSIKRRFEEPRLIRHVKKFDILYIEDNELERKTVYTYFKRKGIDIKSVETSEEGLDIIKVSTPRVILLDIDLKTSNINGNNLCQMLKSTPQYSTIPIILISAVVSKIEKREMLISTGADDIIIKPIEKLSDLDVLFKYLK
jgi:CheY-like chemotaxis protein